MEANEDWCEWTNADDESPFRDMSYLTLIYFQGRHVVEIAPWVDQKYQGSYAVPINLGLGKVLAWMPVPDFTPFIVSGSEKKQIDFEQ